LGACVLQAAIAAADTVSLKSGEDIKGIVVEEYGDRVVISTYEGEKGILKKDIREIRYDQLEQNLVKLGDMYAGRLEYEKAYFYYDKAYRANPSHQAARDKMNYITGYLFRKREQDKLSDVKRRKDFDNLPSPGKSKEDDPKRALIEEVFGISLGDKKNRIEITNVREPSPAHMAGLKKNDALISVWGRLTGYMSAESVARDLLKENFGEIKMDIGREITIKKDGSSGGSYADILGARFDMPVDGLTVAGVAPEGKAASAGLMKNDLITAICGVSTRYMPLKEAIKMIEDRTPGTITLTVRRKVTIWRK